MAEAIRLVCNTCGEAVESWSDGNPYYIDASGRKQYAYHPDHEALARCVGNDEPHLCLGCGSKVTVDSRAPLEACPDCDGSKLVPTFDLDGEACPYCRDGEFRRDPGFLAIS